MLTGEHFWRQGYFEPAAGFDLASLQMSAVEEGDSFICSGAKIDLTSPDVSVRPIVSLTGEAIQSQVFFTGVSVPKADVVGHIGSGWTVAKHVLDFERGTAYAPRIRAELEELRTFASAAPPGQRNLSPRRPFVCR